MLGGSDSESGDEEPSGDADGVPTTLAAHEAARKHDASKSRPEAEAGGSECLFVTDTASGWVAPESQHYNGLLVQRSATWGDHQAWVDKMAAASDNPLSETVQLRQAASALDVVVENGPHDELLERLAVVGARLVAAASLPEPLAQQVKADVCSVGVIVGALCSSSKLLVKLETLGENVCGRWHCDHYVGRAIVSYTGVTGTLYTGDENVNFWELENCGNNDHIIRDQREVRAVAVGDILFIKGTKFPGQGANSLVHKSAEKSYHKDGRLLNRLALKIDVATKGRV
jgi:hypothetical protein